MKFREAQGAKFQLEHRCVWGLNQLTLGTNYTSHFERYNLGLHIDICK